MDRLRSVPLSHFSPLAAIEGVSIYSLQKNEDGRGEPVSLEGGVFRDLGKTFGDFSDTAAAITNLDLVITVDSAVAHLAGALGKETWILLPRQADWRWLRDRPDSPWYASVRLVRQEELGNWKSVFGIIERDLLLAAKEPLADRDSVIQPKLCEMEDQTP